MSQAARRISFRVEGVPAPGGSKRGFVVKRAGGKLGVAMTDAGGERTKNWRQSVLLAARAALRSTDDVRPFDGPLVVDVTFLMPRPKGHYGKAGIKASAPVAPTTKPDATKLWRSTEDAISDAGLWTDDAQVVRQCVSKVYAETALQTGALVTIKQFSPANGAA